MLVQSIQQWPHLPHPLRHVVSGHPGCLARAVFAKNIRSTRARWNQHLQAQRCQSRPSVTALLNRQEHGLQPIAFQRLISSTSRFEAGSTRKCTADEDRILLHMKHTEGRPIREIASQLGRSRTAVQQRYTRQLRLRLRRGEAVARTAKKGRYTYAEDKLLDRLRGEETLTFEDIAYHMHRDVHSIINRYYNFLSHPGQGSRQAKRPYTRAEDDRLLELVKSHGTKWRLIARKMPLRTAGGLRNHYHVTLLPRKRSG